MALKKRRPARGAVKRKTKEATATDWGKVINSMGRRSFTIEAAARKAGRSVPTAGTALQRRALSRDIRRVKPGVYSRG